MKLRNVVVLITLLLMALPSAAAAQVPGFLPVQAFLTDASGVPVDGDVALEFNIYDAANGGTVLHTETQTVQANAGALTAYLGKDAELDLSVFDANEDLFLGVTVDGGDELQPRQRLATVPFAARARSAAFADDAATLDGRPAADFESSYAAASPLEIDSNDQIRIITSCAADSILKWNGTDWECTADADLTAGPGIELSNNQVGLVTCPNGQVLKSDGAVMACANDADTQYGAGEGLSLAGTDFSVNFTTTQRRVSGSCDGANGNDYVTGVLENGTVVCGTDADAGGDITDVTAGDGLAGGSSSGAANLRVADNGIASSMIQGGAVTSAKLASDAVTSAKISDGAIGNADISASAGIDASKIDFGSSGSSVATSFGTFRPVSMCPIGGVDGPPCNGAQPGTFCEGDNTELDFNLNNCSSYDWYFRTN